MDLTLGRRAVEGGAPAGRAMEGPPNREDELLNRKHSFLSVRATSYV